MTVVHSVQTMHLSCAEANTISKQTKTSIHLTYITQEYNRVSQSDFQACWTFLAPKLKLSPNDRNELPLDPRHQGVQSGVSEMISEPMTTHILHRD
jgi:hypothetical protein